MKKIFTLAALAALTLSANAGVKVLVPAAEKNEAKWALGENIWGDADVAVYTSEAATGVTYTYYTDETKTTKSGADKKGKEETPYYTTSENQSHWVADTSAPETFIVGGTTANTKAYIQGSTNGMYYAIVPAKAGKLTVAVKMGANKMTYFLKTTGAAIAEITTEETVQSLFDNELCKASDVKAAITCTTPEVSTSVNGAAATTGTWDGSAAINTSSGNQYLTMSADVEANDIILVACDGSKLMLMGVALEGTEVADGVVATDPNAGTSAVAGIAEAVEAKAAPVKVMTANGIQIGNYNIAGQQVK